jgi:cysteinyl-tRNA synthetase
MLHSAHEYRASARQISIYNSLGGGKILLDPIDPAPVSPELKMYVCGLTPQDHSHVGHGLTVMRFDIIRRYLAYRRLSVNYIQNVTDIDDKIITKVLSLGVDPVAMTREYTDEFYRCAERLHVTPVSKLTRVTEYVPQIITFIEELIRKGFAYATPDGNVYFDVHKKGDYGKLSNQNTNMLYESVRKELDKEKRSPLDFALWKRDDSTSLSSPSPWGVGRPGWHIECSVMIHETLGDHIDIHGGAIDLKFPHHENEIAQSEAFSGCVFANVWMHSGLLNIDGQKMSKSLNNFLRLVDGIERFGVTPLRFAVARHHYRSSIDLTDALFRENLNSLLEFHRLFERMPSGSHSLSVADFSAEDRALVEAFEAAMDNDFNSPEALVALEQARARVIRELDGGQPVTDAMQRHVQLIRELGWIVGVFFDGIAVVESEGLRLAARVAGSESLSIERVSAIIAERRDARDRKDFARSDELRKVLNTHGVDVLDTKSGTSWRFA